MDFGRSRSRSKRSPWRADLRHRQERLDPVGARDRPRPRPASAVRLRERLVQVEVDDVEAHVARAGDPHHRVQVRAVVVERRARVVHDARDLLDVPVEQPERVRVREHQAGHVVARLLAQVVDVHPAVGRGAHLHDLVARHRHRRRVRAVRGVRREHLGPLLAAVLVVGAREQQAGQLAVRARARLERDVRQARHLGERLLEVPHQLERALGVLGVLKRMQPRVAGQRRHPLVQLRVVLHRAGAERIEALVQVEVLRRERRVVPDQLRLRDLGQLGGALARHSRGQELLDRHLGHIGRRRDEGAAAAPGALVDRERVLRHAGAPSRTGAPTREARRSMCSLVRRSVTATSSPSENSG